LLPDGTFKVEITKVGKNTALSEDLGTFNSYEEAKAELFKRFFDFFNRPSQNAIDSGTDPTWRVWTEYADGRPKPHDSKGQQVARSISLIEGDEAKAILGARVESVELTPKGRKMKSYTIRVPDVGMPTVISVRTLYPSYFKHIEQLHSKRVARLKRMRQRRK